MFFLHEVVKGRLQVVFTISYIARFIDISIVLCVFTSQYSAVLKHNILIIRSNSLGILIEGREGLML